MAEEIDPGGRQIRKGEMSGRMRWVLGVSLASAVVILLIVYAVFMRAAP